MTLKDLTSQIDDVFRKYTVVSKNKDALLGELQCLALCEDSQRYLFPIYDCLRRLPMGWYAEFLRRHPIEVFNRWHQALSATGKDLSTVAQKEFQHADQLSEQRKSIYIFSLLRLRDKYRHVIQEEEFDEVLESENRTQSRLQTWFDKNWEMPDKVLLEVAFLDYDCAIQQLKKKYSEESLIEFAMESAPDFSKGRIGSARLILTKYARWISALEKPENKLKVAERVIAIARRFDTDTASVLTTTFFEVHASMIAELPIAMFAALHDWVHPTLIDREKNQKPRWRHLVQHPEALKKVVQEWSPPHRQSALMVCDEKGMTLYHHAFTHHQKPVVDFLNETLTTEQRLGLLYIKKIKVKPALTLLTYEQLSWVFYDFPRIQWLSLLLINPMTDNFVAVPPRESVFRDLLDSYTHADFFRALNEIKIPVVFELSYYYVYRVIKDRLITALMNVEESSKGELTPDLLRRVFPLNVLYPVLHRYLGQRKLVEDLFHHAESMLVSLDQRQPDDFDYYLLVRYQLQGFLQSPPIQNHLGLFASPVDPLAIQLETSLNNASNFLEAHGLIREYMKRSKNAFTKKLKNTYQNPKQVLETLFEQVKRTCVLN